MELKLVRGPIAEVSAADSRGRVVLRIGDRSIRLHRDLASAAVNGDDILVGGELRDDVVHALAVKNFTRGKLHKLDFTFHILGAGAGACAALMGLIFWGQTTGLENTISFVTLIIGVALAFVVLRRVLRIVKITRWVDSEKQ